MTFVNNISQNYSSNAIGFNNSNGDGARELKLTFTPEELGVKRGRDGKYPPQARFTENNAEKALFKFFGLNPDNPQDLQRIKARLQTSESPFAKLKTTNNYPARFNYQTGKYEAVFQIDRKTYAQMRGQIAEIKNDPPTGNASNPLTKPDPNDFYARQQKAKLEAKLPPQRLETASLTPEQKELLLDLTDLGLSVIGIFEPTPFSDLAGTGLALSRGEYGGAAISALGMIPYLGDLAKLGKLPKLVKVMDAVVSIAKADGKFAKLVEPMLKNLKKALDALPIDKLPNWAKESIEKLSTKIDDFFGIRKVVKPAITADGQKAVTLDTLEHIFHGEVKTGRNGATRSVGFHYEGAEMQAVKKTKVVESSRSAPDANGVYEAQVEIQGVAKRARSSFFPKNWTKNDVVNAVNEAYVNKTIPNPSKPSYFEGRTSSGVTIGGYLNADGTIATAFPLYGR